MKLLSANTFDIRNFEPSRVTPKSKNCSDHMVTRNEFEAETIQTTLADYYAAVAHFPAKSSTSKNCCLHHK